MDKIYIEGNLINILDITVSKNDKYIISITDLTTIITNVYTSESEILNFKLDNVVISDDNKYFSGIRNDNTTIIGYNLEEGKIYNKLTMNLDNNDKVNIIKYCKENKLIIATQSGHLYYYSDNVVLNFNGIPQIVTDTTIKDIDISNNNEYICVLCKSYFFLLNTKKTNVIHPNLDINCTKYTQIRISSKNKFVYLISNSSIIIFKNDNYQNKFILCKVCFIKIPNINNIELSIENENLLLVNTTENSILYYIKEKASLYYENIRIEKINYNTSVLSQKEYNIYIAKKNYLIKYNFETKIGNVLFNIIDKKKSMFMTENSLFQKNNELIMNNELIQYDTHLECIEIDYRVKVHSFVFLSKIPYFFDLYNKYNFEYFKLPLENINLPDQYAIDQFIRFVYTNNLPDSEIVINNIDFFIYICNKLWYGEENNLKKWVEYVKSNL